MRIRMLRALGIAYFMFFFCMYITTVANAYIDPAMTAMMTQIIAAAFISVGVVFGVFRRKIIFFFKNIGIKHTKRKIEKQNVQKKSGT